MRLIRLQRGIARLETLEVRLCGPLNILARHAWVRDYFKLVSRLGDGVAWYAMLCVLPLVFGREALPPSLAMTLTGLAGVVLYKFLKATLVRERPFSSHTQLQAITVPLDKYSFPSGHALHATAFILQLSEYFPQVMVLMLPFAVSVVASRVVLGLHYPSDVAAGIILGWGLAAISLSLAHALGV